MSYNNNTLPRSGKINIDQSTLSTSRATRPVSLYDNIQQQDLTCNSLNVTPSSSPNNYSAPSQALCLSTTVPVNFARAPIAGRHTPTRASLRHSRMLVLSQQTGRVPWKYLPPVVRCHRLASGLMVLLVLLGAAGVALALYLALLAPFLSVLDLPFWSGALNLISGLFGLLLVCWCRRVQPGVQVPEWVCVVRQPYITLSIGFVILASAASICAFVFVITRLIWLFQVECLTNELITPNSMKIIDNKNITIATLSESEDRINSTSLMVAPHSLNCVCNSTTNGELYEGLACSSAKANMMAIIAGSGAVHALAVMLTVGYLVIHWRSRRYGQPIYTNAKYTSTPRLVATAL